MKYEIYINSVDFMKKIKGNDKWDKPVIEVFKFEGRQIKLFPFPPLLKVCDLNNRSFQTYYTL